MISKIKKRIDKNQYLKINNIKIYFSFAILSIIFILISHIFNHEILNILENISYSILAATLMAYFMDYNNLKIKQNDINEFRTTYLEEINIHLSLMIGHLLWLEEHINDESINWDLEPQSYLKIDFAVFVSTNYEKQVIPFNQAIKKLEKISNKYSYDKIEGMSEKEKNKIRKIFKISSLECERLLVELDTLYKDKIILDVKNYIPLKDTEKLIWDISICKKIMEKEKDTNYKVAINLLISSAKTIKKIGDYNNPITINLMKVLLNMMNYDSLLKFKNRI